MIFTFLKSCFFACLLFIVIAVGTVVSCYFLACSPPSFYAAALAEPVDETDVAAAIEEMEQAVGAMEVFVKLDTPDLEKLQAMPEKDLATTHVGRRNAKVSLLDALQTLNASQGATPDTFVLSLTERHLNAYLNKELNSKGGDLQRPLVSLQDDTVRFAATLVTSVAEVALSCDFQLSKTQQTDLIFELQAVRVGKLPVPAKTILKQCMRTNPVLPQGIELNADGDRPTLTFTAMPDDGKLQLDDLHIADGVIELTFRRTADKKLATK